MNNKISKYLDRLKEEMSGLDAALIRDALSDAEEHLRTALAESLKENPGTAKDRALEKIIDRYGSPVETAAGFLIFTLTLHLARGVGRLHGKFARAVFVGE